MKLFLIIFVMTIFCGLVNVASSSAIGENLHHPDAHFSETEINFQGIRHGDWAHDTLRVSNIGSAVLNISEVRSDSPEFSASLSKFSIFPGGFRDVGIIAFPDSLRDYSGRLIFLYENSSLSDTIQLKILNTFSPRPAQQITVSSASALKSAAQNAAPGDIIEVADGSYNSNGSMTMRHGGTKSFPIEIRARNRGNAELTGDSYFDLRECAHVHISGFKFTSTDKTVIKLQASNHIRISRNIFRIYETSSNKWIVVGGIWDNPNKRSFANRIDHNLFENKTFPGNCITIDGGSDPVYQVSQYDTINYNHFRNVGPRQGNDFETIRLGWSEMSMSSGFSIVEHNLFEDCDGDPEIISVKCCDNTVRHNTFRNSQGTLCLRHGNRTRVEGNFFLADGKSGCGGIRLYGDDHVIFNNYFSGLTGEIWDAPITLTNGDYDGGGNLTKHFRINRAMIQYNTLVNNWQSIEIGYTNNGNYGKPPRDVLIADNIVVGKTNELVKIITQPVNMTWQGNIMYPTDSAILGISASPGEIQILDPQLVFGDSVWHISAGSPAINAGTSGASFLVYDMDGQLRDANADVGADEYSTAPVRYRPLTAADVGPDGPEIFVPIIRMGENNLADDFEISRNYPNPFNPQTTIEFDLPKAGLLKIDIYNLSGQRVETLVHERVAGGRGRVTWNAGQYASGMYFGKIQYSGQTKIIKMILLK